MAIATLHRTISQTLLLLGIIFLVACGGGDNKPPKDSTPEAFSFTAIANAATSAVVTSPAITVSGIDAPAAVSITGGEYSISGGAFTASPGIVSSGQTIALKMTTSSVTNTSVEAVLSVGGVSATFRVTTAPDVTPGNFNFAPAADAALSTAITSNPITLSGFDVAVPVSITNGEYSVNGGAFSSAAGTVSPAQTLAVKVVSSNTNSTAVEAVLTVGGVIATYRVTTLADAIPNTFTFTPAIDAAPGSTSISNAITVEGIEVAVPIAITGGEYSINDGAFTSAPGSVTNGQTIAVRATAPAGTELTQKAVVTIGGLSGTYAVTTIPDTTAPVAEFKFPTPYTMSEAMSVKVRGTATDEHIITGVKVVVSNNLNSTTSEIAATPKATGDFSSWTADIPLTALAENEIKVMATDDRNNSTVIEAANKITIRQADVKSAFPDDVNQFDNAVSLVFDKYDGRNRALIASSYGGDKNVIAVDLTTGKRSIAFASPDCSLFGLTIDPITKHIFGACHGELYEFNLSDGALIGSYRIIGSSATIPAIAIERNNGRERLVLLERKESGVSGSIFSFALDTKIFSTVSAADQLPPFQIGESILLDGDHYLVPGSDLNSEFGGQIISVNALDGTRKVISDNSIGTGDLYGGSDYLDIPFLSAIAKDSRLNRLFVFEYWSSRIFTVDLETFNRKIFTDISYVQPDIATRTNVGSIDMEIDETREHIFVADEKRQAIIIVDIETGEKVILSKSTNSR